MDQKEFELCMSKDNTTIVDGKHIALKTHHFSRTSAETQHTSDDDAVQKTGV